MSEHVSLLSKDPMLFGDNNRFMALGLLGIRGEKYIAFMDLTDGQVYVEETFAHSAGDAKAVTLNYIEDDMVWKLCVYAINAYGLDSRDHITACTVKLGLSTDNKVVSDILKGIPPLTAQNTKKK